MENNKSNTNSLQTTGASPQAFSRWDIPNKVPLDGEISFVDLSKTTQRQLK